MRITEFRIWQSKTRMVSTGSPSAFGQRQRQIQLWAVTTRSSRKSTIDIWMLMKVVGLELSRELCKVTTHKDGSLLL